MASYPDWLQNVVRDTDCDKSRVVNSEFLRLMRDARMPLQLMCTFLIGAWPTIEQFPCFMAMNLKRIGVGDSHGEDIARQFLIHNIRVEQKHADLCIDWASSVDLTLDDLSEQAAISRFRVLDALVLVRFRFRSPRSGDCRHELRHQGADGGSACLVYSETAHADSIPEQSRTKATRWLRVHAHYDDEHPWKALDIVARLLGNSPSQAEVEGIRRAVRSSHAHFSSGVSATRWKNFAAGHPTKRHRMPLMSLRCA